MGRRSPRSARSRARCRSTARCPFWRPSPRRWTPPTPGPGGEALPEPVWQALREPLRKDPAARPGNAGQAGRRLREAAEQAAVQAAGGLYVTLSFSVFWWTGLMLPVSSPLVLAMPGCWIAFAVRVVETKRIGRQEGEL